MEDFLTTVLPRSADTVGIRGQLHPNLFCALPNFAMLRKICVKHIMRTKFFPLKIYRAPQTLKPGYGPDSAKIVSALGYFVLQVIRTRNVA